MARFYTHAFIPPPPSGLAPPPAHPNGRPDSEALAAFATEGLHRAKICTAIEDWAKANEEKLDELAQRKYPDGLLQHLTSGVAEAVGANLSARGKAAHWRSDEARRIAE